MLKQLWFFAVIFMLLFFVGVSLGVISLPEFLCRFFVSGLVFGAFGTGAGTFILGFVFRR